MGTLEVKGLLAALLLAFGIAAPVPEFIAGLSLCIGGAYLALLWRPPEEKGSLWATIVTALVIGMIAAIAHASIPFLKSWSFHLIMGGAGLLSRPIVLAGAAFGAGMVNRAGSLPGSIKLPGEE